MCYDVPVNKNEADRPGKRYNKRKNKRRKTMKNDEMLNDEVLENVSGGISQDEALAAALKHAGLSRS